MSSIEKKEIIQNGIFGTAAGLVMGGPIGGAMAAGAAIGIGVIQEKRDEELRQKEWERNHANPADIYTSIKNTEAKLKDRKSTLNRIDIIIKSSNYQTIHCTEIYPDPNRISREKFNSHGHCILNPEKAPYVLVSMFDAEKFGRVWIKRDCIVNKVKGKLLDINDFEETLLNDKDNPRIKKFIIDYGRNYLHNTGVKYAYSIDDCSSFIMCYKSVC